MSIMKTIIDVDGLCLLSLLFLASAPSNRSSVCTTTDETSIVAAMKDDAISMFELLFVPIAVYNITKIMFYRILCLTILILC